MRQVKYDKLSEIVEKEIKEIRAFPHWVNAWWTPNYFADRMLALLKDINSKNKDIEYIRSKNNITSRWS